MKHLPRRGAGLIEVLVAFLVISLSLVGAQRVQSMLRLHADVARERGEAVQLAQKAMEQLRSGSEGPSAAGDKYTLQSTTGERNALGLQSRFVQAQWSDRTGDTHHVKLASATAGGAAVYEAALALAPQQGPLRRAFPQQPAGPSHHKALGDGRSVHKPREHGTLALVFDAGTGHLLQSCRVDAHRRTQDLGVDDLHECTAFRGSLLSGHLRFANAASALDGEPLPLRLGIVFSSPSSGPAQCEAEPMKTVRVTRGEHTRTEAVPLQATPRELGATALVDLGERFTAFTCVIVDARWSGQLVFEPQGWALGDTARDHRVCRIGQPQAPYRDASGALRQQNFLVTRGDRPCPGGPTHNVAPASAAPSST
jgi:Tfp pilus assembly protein PilV